MKCQLCKKSIENYNSTFNHLKIDEKNSIDICSSCIDKLLKWQQETYANLFPTKAIKKRYSKK